MKRLISALIITIGVTGGAYAANESTKLNNNEYISKLNDSIGEMNDCIKEEGDAFDLVFNIKKGYLNKSIDAMDSMIENYSSLSASMKDIKLKDKELQEKHNKLMEYYIVISEDLKVLNEEQKELLNKDYNGFATFKELLDLESKYGNNINDKVEDANLLYEEIQNFWIE